MAWGLIPSGLSAWFALVDAVCRTLWVLIHFLQNLPEFVEHQRVVTNRIKKVFFCSLVTEFSMLMDKKAGIILADSTTYMCLQLKHHI